ncbi:hypothetical protein [Cyanobium sp. Aljojuca 7D2]|uniref:hypothetical protein n=1 Tax=Cyanobium sp. Aljojuca 7D2 TaxID=2823698 RepID=UPI0020CF438A|nr:hypothetical protein [Cyanobium sp. Aljojuca 7D2]
MTVGIQVRNLYDLSLANQSFLAEGWYWLNWGDDVQAVLERLKIEPSEIVEFSNEIEPGSYRVSEVLPENVQFRPDAPHSVYVKFSGRFYINDVAQRLAPFDQQHLDIALEVKPSGLSEGRNRIALIPAPVAQAPIAGEFTSVSGFNLVSTGWTRQKVRTYQPLSTQGGEGLPAVDYSRATAIFTYAPAPFTVFLKWMLPLFAVMGIVILAPSIDGDLGDVRLAIPSAALLTLVVMHDSYKTNFPPAPYLTYLDEIYTYCYIVCFTIFLLFLVGTNAHNRSSDNDRETITKTVNRLDLIVQVSAVSGFLIVASVGWFS